MTTLKKYLIESKLSVTDAQRFDLGYKVARLWDKELQGSKSRVKEDGFIVRNYPITFLNSESCTKLILNYMVDDFESLSNLF